MERLLWRLQGVFTLPSDLTRFDAGLRLHLEHTDLTTIIAQIGNEQRAYVSGSGCAGCQRGRCLPGCRAELLRRMLRATVGEIDLSLVSAGLAAGRYTQAVLARPTPESRPISGADLGGWEDARLIAYWPQTTRGAVATVALLAASDGPDLATLVQEHRWLAHRLPAGIGTRLANSAIPGRLWFGRAWPGPPYLLIPKGLVSAGGTAAAQGGSLNAMPTDELAVNELGG